MTTRNTLPAVLARGGTISPEFKALMYNADGTPGAQLLAFAAQVKPSDLADQLCSCMHDYSTYWVERFNFDRDAVKAVTKTHTDETAERFDREVGEPVTTVEAIMIAGERLTLRLHEDCTGPEGDVIEYDATKHALGVAIMALHTQIAVGLVATREELDAYIAHGQMLEHDAHMYDASDYDVALQLGLLGEARFG